MARKFRVEYEGAIYHVMNRGDRRELIFLDDEDRQRFLDTLGEACCKTGWQVHALCLMPNHFHLVVETPQPNLVAGMKWLLGTYAARFNRRHKFFGHLFSGRYKTLIVDGSGTGYLKTVCDYVHLNRARARLLTPEQPLAEYRWSSWPESSSHLAVALHCPHAPAGKSGGSVPTNDSPAAGPPRTAQKPADRQSARVVMGSLNIRPFSLLSFCYTCEHRFREE
jgi:REP element-mobilizing transposase RayT